MKLDILLSKYLDGELTSDEDRELRQLISHNPDAKQAFDTSVALHMALRQDAATMIPPAQLVRETEEQILMKILNQPTPYRARKRTLFFLPTTVLMGVIVAVLMPMMTHDIGKEQGFVSRVIIADTPVTSAIANREEKTSDHGASSLAKNVNTLSLRAGRRTVASSAPIFADAAFSHGKKLINASLHSSLSSMDNDNITSDEQVEKENLSDIPFAESDHTLIPVERSFTSASNLTRFSSTPSLISSTIPGGNLFSGLLTQSNIHISTTFGTNLIADAGTGQPKSGLAFMSQSLAYSIGENERAGLELGYMWFTYVKPVVAFIPSRTKNTSVVVVKPSEKEGETPIGDGDNSDLQAGEYVYTQQPMNKQTFWGAAFYERVFYKTEKMTFQARAGLGGSNDGVLGYARAVGLLNVMSNTSITFGIDARGMMLKTPYLSPKSHSMQMGVSFIYGLQFHF